MENQKPKKFLSLKIKTTISIVSFVIFILGIVFFISYINTREIIEHDLRDRLQNMVGIGALQVNGKGHNELQTLADEDSVAYKYFIKILRDIDKSSSDIYFIYTMRQDAQGQIVFVVDADNTGNVSHIGEVYNDASPFLRNNFNRINQPVTEEDFYTDKWGTWLSGYAPIYDEAGNKEGLLAIDISAADLISRENNLKLAYLLGFIIFGLFSVILSLLLSNRLTKSLISLTRFVKDMDETPDLEVETINNDEVSELAGALNAKMTKVNLSQSEKDQRIIEKNKMLERTNKLMIGRELEMIKLKKEIVDLKNKLNL